MDCCTECFSSLYLRDIINRNNKKNTCEFCLSENVYTYDCKDLSLFFKGILDLYIVDNTIGEQLEIQIENDYPQKIFSSKINDTKRRLLITSILEYDYLSYQHLFENKISLSFSKSQGIVEPLHISWSKFAEEIKFTNRFHIQNILDLKKLEILLNRYKRPISKGKIFYRGRISDEKGYDLLEMGNPPADKAKSGRANPNGISYLYISDKVETTLYETRATLLDYVTIGKFRLKEDINVINLRGNIYDPVLLAENEELEDFMIHLPFISKLEQELSKPNRRSDKELDYLPTQYLSEFIKSLGYDGVEYQSSLYEEGYNIAIFNTEKMECISVEVHEINNITFSHNVLT